MFNSFFLSLGGQLNPIRSGTIHLHRFKSAVSFQTYNDLEREIEMNEKWQKSLRYTDFEIKFMDGNKLKPFPPDLIGVPMDDVKIIVVILCSGFSKQAEKSDIALNSIGVTQFKSISNIPTRPELFPECNVPDEILLSETQKVLTNLQDRSYVINRKLASEYTMREFISPVLIGVLKVIIMYDEVRFGDGKLSMVCEKRIIGKRAHGPVDYSFLFDCLDLVLTEAKRENLDFGIVQNLLQQRACQEFLANTLINYDFIQEERKRKFAEAFADVARTNTCGITSTGAKWVFSQTKCMYNEITNTMVTDVFISETIEIDLAAVNEEKLKRLISRIVHLVLSQADGVTANHQLAERRRTIIPSDSNVMISLQEIEHNRAADGEKLLNHIEAEDEAEDFD